MPYVIITNAFAPTVMYFMEYTGNLGGFCITNDKALARTYDSRREAMQISEALSRVSGFTTAVKRK